MLKITGTLLLASSLLLAGCGGSGGSSGSSSVTVTPSGTLVLAGASLQMKAVAADGSANFTWQVNGTTGGSNSIGTISANGLYTAPDFPPVGGQVTITAIEQAHTMQSGTATLNIGFSNASLNGPYVFTLGGLNNTVPWSAIGEFTSNGAGQLDGGLEDINNGASSQTKQPFSGNYSVNPDGTGTAALGTVNVQFVLLSGGGANLIRTDQGTVAAGSFTPQSQTVGSVSNLGGPYVFSLAGEDTSNQSITMLGRLVATSTGSFAEGTEDANGPISLVNAFVSGSYAFDGSNHGTITLIDSNGTHKYTFYLASASDLELLSSDVTRPLSGSLMLQQTITFTNASLNGACVFFVDGGSPTQSYAQAGQFNPNGAGSLGTVTEDINTPGNIQNGINPLGTYALDSSGSGRGILTINNPGTSPQTYVFYMTSIGQAQVMTMNSNIIANGLILTQAQGSSFSNASLDSHYGFLLFSQTNAQSASLGLGTLVLDGNADLSGSLIQNLNGSIPSKLSLAGSYMLNDSVRGTATIASSGGGSSPFALYPLNPGEFLLIGTNSASPYMGVATSQY